MRAAIYARVSTFEQEPENQLHEIRRYVEARGWAATEFVDRGISGSKDKRPALDPMLCDAKRRKFDVVVCWRLDRLGRNLRHLIMIIDELAALGVSFVSLAEGIDATTPAGRLQLHVLGAIAEFERARLRERLWRVWHEHGRKVSGSADHGETSPLNGWRQWQDCRRGKPPGGSVCHAPRCSVRCRVASRSRERMPLETT